MADPTTTNINLAVPTRGSDPGTWDVPLNGDMTIIDACFGAVTTKALTNTNISLTTTEAQASIIRLTGTLTGNVAVFFPSSPIAIIKSWSIDNRCTGNFYIVAGNASGGNVVGIPPGESVDIYSDGTNMYYRNLGRVGSYLDHAAATVPAWITNSTVPPYLNCDGSTFSSGTYPALAAILGTTTLPDLRGRQRIYLNQGTGRVTTANGGVDGNTRFAVGGNPSLAISQPELPAYSPTFVGNTVTWTIDQGSVPANTQVRTTTIDAGQNVVGYGGYIGPLTVIITPSGTITPLGSGTPHINMDPTCVGGITMIRAA